MTGGAAIGAGGDRGAAAMTERGLRERRGGGSRGFILRLSFIFSPLHAAGATARDVGEAAWGAAQAEQRGYSLVTRGSVVLRPKNCSGLPISRVVYLVLDAGYVILRRLETVP